MNNTKRKHVEMAGAILLLSLVAPATVFASSGEGITQVEPKPEVMEEVKIDAEDVSIDNVILVDGPTGPGHETVEEVQDLSDPTTEEIVVKNEEAVEEVQQDIPENENLASNTTEMVYAEGDMSVQEVPSIEKAPYIPYTAEDVRVLARAAYFEMEMAINRSNAEYIFKMTMSVILNRVTAPDFPSTVSSVVFSGGYAKRTQRLVNSGTIIPDILYVWAEDLLKNGPNVPTNVIYQAGFKQGHGVYDKILGNYFCVR